jgi:aminoglycoside 3-N-acetyltransferase I
MDIRRLAPGDEAQAYEMLSTMAEVFEEHCDEFSHEHVQRLLARPDFWAVVAMDEAAVVGGITAYALPMTRTAVSELFIYDVAVRVDRQRTGVGRALMNELLSLAASAGIKVAFVPADNEDTHALDFYRALGGEASPVTFFTFSR